MSNQDGYRSTVIRPDTGVEKVVSSVQESIKESDFLDFEKDIIRVKIHKLENDLLYWSQPHRELTMLPNTREDIMYKLERLYRYRNEVYCAEEGEYPDEPLDC